MGKKHYAWMIMALAMMGIAQAQMNTLSQSYVSGAISFSQFVASANSWVSPGTYQFSYPADKLDGYYVVKKRYCPQAYCNSCIGTESCNQITSDLYVINQGYQESFTYTANYPIYGAWEIDDFTDFRSKCFVGDCNKANLRHVLCFDSNGIPSGDSFTCDKWTYTYSRGNSRFCVNGDLYVLWDEYASAADSSLNFGYDTCSEPTTINFYYVYNDWPGYEGYDANWRNRWAGLVTIANQELSPYNIQLVGRYYEYKIPDDSGLPAAIFDDIDRPSDPGYRAGDIHVTIPAGTENPGSYGYTCPGDTTYNPCSADSAIRIPDYYSFTNQEVLIHEIGHRLGCPHTGNTGSLSAHQYVGDIMSYGVSEGIFKYECRLVLWVMGRNG